ncbi:MAG: MlaD family protein [Phycisphaerales bacterium]
MSDYETTQRRRNITVGIFVFIALCALVWLIFMFNDLPGAVTTVRSYQVFVQFPSAQGVQEDTPVQFCGYQVGRVTDIMPPEPRYDKENKKTYHQTMCVLGIERKYKTIPSNADIKVITRGLGSSYIDIQINPNKDLVPLDPNHPKSVYLCDKIRVQGSTGVANEFFPLESQRKLDKLADDLSTLINNTNEIIGDKQNKENIKKMLANLTDASEHAADALEDFQKFSVAGTETGEELAKTVAELRLLIEKINAGDGTAGMLVNDARLYENLVENTEQLQVLIEDIRNFVAEYRAGGIKVKL